MAKDVLRHGGQLTVAAIDPVDLPGAVEPNAGFEHVGSFGDRGCGEELLKSLQLLAQCEINGIRVLGELGAIGFQIRTPVPL